MEEHAGLSLDDGVECAAGAVGDDRPAGRLGLKRRDAKILLAWQDVGPASGKEVGQVIVGHAAQESDVGMRQGLQRGPVSPVASDDQRQPQLVEGAHGQVNPLVGDQAGDDEVIVVVGGGGAEAGGVHRRVDDDRVAAIIAADAGLYFGRDGDKVIHPLGGPIVPAAQERDDWTQCGLEGRRQRLAGGVGLEIPDVPRGSQAVAYVDCSAGSHAVTEAGFVAQHQVVAREIESGKGQGVEGQVGLVVAVDARQVGHPGGADVPGAVGRGHSLAPVH